MRVIVADDSALFREGFARVLTEIGFQVVGMAATPDELFRLIEARVPEVAIIDIRMPPTHTVEGLEAALRVRRGKAGIGVLLLSQYVETQHVLRLLGDARGGVGYLLKDSISDLGTLADALRTVASGETLVDRQVMAQLMARPRRADPLTVLSERERLVLAMMAEGRSNGAIGRGLNVSERTVEAHVHAIFTKLRLETTPDTHRRVLAVLTYLRV
jgi:DNA-binding NarL/FixJ family response regulator